MNVARISKWSATLALAFCGCGFTFHHWRKSQPLPAPVVNALTEMRMAQTAYDSMGVQLDSLVGKVAAADSEPQVTAARAEFCLGITNMVESLKRQADLIGAGRTSTEIESLTGVKAKSTVERAEALSKMLVKQSEELAGKGGNSDPKGFSSVTNKMTGTFNESKKRQENAIAGMLKKNVDDKTIEALAESLPSKWKRIGSQASLSEEKVKQSLEKSEDKEKKAATAARKLFRFVPESESQPSAPAPLQPLTVTLSSPSVIADDGVKPSGPPSAQSLIQEMFSSEFLKAEEVWDNVLMAYRDMHLPQNGDSASAIWSKMGWMIRMGFDSKALDCLDGYRLACKAESEDNELDESTRQLTDSAEQFIREMRDLNVSGGVMVASVLDGDDVSDDGSEEQEKYRVGDIITSVGTNACQTVAELKANYVVGETVESYSLEPDGVLVQRIQEATGRGLDKVDELKEISK